MYGGCYPVCLFGQYLPLAGCRRHHALSYQGGGEKLLIESCGLGDWHLGSLPDERMREAAKNRGYILMSQARGFKLDFFDQFQLILAADHKVMNELYRHAATPEYKSKIHLITHFSSCYKDQEIPDPYYQGKAGFELVLDMLEDSCEGLLLHLKKG